MTSVAEHLHAEQGPDLADVAILRIALAGCGAVGSALVREIAARTDALAERHGVEVAIVKVLVRDVSRRRDADLDPALLTNDVAEFLATDADIVVEAIGGLDTAHTIATTVLGRGQRLVTANKQLLASCGTSLAALARRHGSTLRYDAAVGGGVPILRVLDEALGAGGASRVRGILNGTTNFVLSRLEEGETLEAALTEARAAGFAEADASRDLDGRDAADKLALIAWTAFGVAPETLRVRRTSLLPDPVRFATLARRLGLRARQIAECVLVDGDVIASVGPLLVEPEHALARTHDEGNHVDVFTGWRAPLCASGPGAGGAPTAVAILSDVVATSAACRRQGKGNVATHDPRALRWAIEIRGDASVLHRTIPRCRRVFTNDDASAAWTVVDGTTAAEIDRLVAVLSHGGVDPVAARIDEGCRSGLVS